MTMLTCKHACIFSQKIGNTPLNNIRHVQYNTFATYHGTYTGGHSDPTAAPKTGWCQRAPAVSESVDPAPVHYNMLHNMLKRWYTLYSQEGTEDRRSLNSKPEREREWGGGRRGGRRGGGEGGVVRKQGVLTEHIN